MARIVKVSHSFACIPHVYTMTELAIPAFAFPAITGPHLPTPKAWKAELSWATKSDYTVGPGLLHISYRGW